MGREGGGGADAGGGAGGHVICSRRRGARSRGGPLPVSYPSTVLGHTPPAYTHSSPGAHTPCIHPLLSWDTHTPSSPGAHPPAYTPPLLGHITPLLTPPPLLGHTPSAYTPLLSWGTSHPPAYTPSSPGAYTPLAYTPSSVYPPLIHSSCGTTVGTSYRTYSTDLVLRLDVRSRIYLTLHN